MRDVVNCHCTMCRRVGFVANVGVRRGDFVLLASATLKVYPSSATVRRSFCGECGAQIYWDPLRQDFVVIAAGTLDQPTGIKTVAHIYVANKPDYYDVNDGLPVHLGPMFEQEG